MKSNVSQEINALLSFLTDFQNGSLGKEDISRLEQCLAPSFKIVTTSGILLTKNELIKGIDRSHNTESGLRRWAEDVEVQEISSDIYLATFKEFHGSSDFYSERISSALFEKAEDTPFGVHWLHIQDTWIK